MRYGLWKLCDNQKSSPAQLTNMTTSKRYGRIMLLLLLLALVCQLVVSCSASLLPLAKESLVSPWKSFAEAKQTFDLVVPYQTSVSDLQALAFSPYQNPNIEIVSYLKLINRFMPNSSVRKEDLAAGVLECIESHDKCYGYELTVSRLESQRYGNVFLDLFNFKRKTHKTGWQFNALIIIKDNQVVYKLWSGKPKIDQYEYKKNPLGPIQKSENVIQTIAIETTFE